MFSSSSVCQILAFDKGLLLVNVVLLPVTSMNIAINYISHWATFLLPTWSNLNHFNVIGPPAYRIR